MANKKDLLKQADIFQDLTDSQLSTLALKAELELYRKNDIIYNDDDKAEFAYFIIDGWVKLFKQNNQQESIIAIIHKNNTFGDISPLLKLKYSVSAQAVTTTKVLKIPYDDFLNTLKNNQQSLITLLKIFSQRQAYLIEEIQRLGTSSANDKIKLFLYNMLKNSEISEINPDNSALINLPYSKSLVAKQLNMQSETFSRAIAKLKEENIIEISKRCIKINNIQSLKDNN